MKTKSKKKKILAVMGGVALIAFGVFFYLNFIRIRNVFDLMYYDRVHHTNCNQPFTPKPENKCQNLEQLVEHGRDAEGTAVEEGCFFESYKQEYLPENHHIHIYFRVEKKILSITYGIDDVDGSGNKWYSYKYSVEDKTMTYKTNDPENTEYKNFIYDIFLTDWFAANPSLRYSIKHLGHVTWIDTTAEE